MQGGRTTFGILRRKVDAQFGKVGPRIEDEVKRVITYFERPGGAAGPAELVFRAARCGGTTGTTGRASGPAR